MNRDWPIKEESFNMSSRILIFLKHRLINIKSILINSSSKKNNQIEKKIQFNTRDILIIYSLINLKTQISNSLNSSKNIKNKSFHLINKNSAIKTKIMMNYTTIQSLPEIKSLLSINRNSSNRNLKKYLYKLCWKESNKWWITNSDKDKIKASSSNISI